ncbi:galectin-8 [Austrofundulus limnaeus]|uniref:Galectin n=1 Tax=Austrofundulus limnaeus TaxID=52670 RepID=A0A2I4CPM3_AUSLI|nr:PREDICTED: galectin-8-like [Austrofundulus limnaeus]
MAVFNPRQMFSNPTLPFVGTILGGLVPGEMVLVQGSVPPDADRFQIDFTCGSSTKPRADVAFHFNPRFNKKCVVCNSLQNERWGREEILHRMPFKVGAAFELVFLVLKDCFKVAVNGAHLVEYKHRVDLERVDTIMISGRVRIQVLGVVPPASNPVSPAASLTSLESEPVVSSSGDLRIPFTLSLGEGLSDRHRIIIKGQINKNGISFVVNLRESSGTNIALHLNPRMKKKDFIRNSYLGECWGPEEKSLECFPFSDGEYFEMIIICESQQFRVAVNGRHQLDYKHRVQDLTRIKQLEVLGDVSLLDVRVL